MLDILVGMLKRERERVQGDPKPSSSESISDRRTQESVHRRKAGSQNTSGREVSLEQPSHEVKQRCHVAEFILETGNPSNRKPVTSEFPALIYPSRRENRLKFVFRRANEDG